MKKYSQWTTALFITFTLLLQLQWSGVTGSNPVLLYSTGKDIRMVNTTRVNNKIKTTFLVRNLTDGAAIDYHYARKKLCWADDGLENIQCITYNGTETENKVEVVSGVLSPDGLACDWLSHKLYWTDSETNRIEVATIDGRYRKVLYWSEVDQPRAIVVVPMKGLLFWTDWGEVPKIERAGMNGDSTTRRVLITERIFWPNGLTVDYEAEKIYWTDGKLLFIEMMDYDGRNRVTIGLKVYYPFALTLFESKLYWTDWKTWTIYVSERNSTEHPKELIRLNDLVPMDIHVWDPARQPYRQQPCEIDNGGCSHLCLLAPYAPGYTCACPIGIKLLDNKTCADGPEELLILARRTDICVVYLDTPDYTYSILPLRDVKYAIAVDYDPVSGFIYWTDDIEQRIQRARLNGTDQQDVISVEIQHPDGIAIDWISRNMYWTDTGTDRIEVARIETGHRKVVISDGLNEPRAIAIASEIGWMFWSDWYEKSPKIERANLDGSNRKVIVSTRLQWPNGVAVDAENERIYWCDAKTDKIEYANMDGSERRELINDNLPHAFGFSLMGQYLYWTDWQRRAIDRAHKETGNQREIIVEQIANVMGVKAIQPGMMKGWNPCTDNNGNCSHLCLYRNDKTRICACQIEYELTKDGLNCVVPEAFLIYTKQSAIGRLSLENINPHNDEVIPLSGIRNASSVDVDINNKRIYWSDSQQRTIMRAFINGSDPQRVVDLGLYAPEGIAVDWLALNVYWADPLAHKIEVARLTGSSRRVLIWKNVDEPHSIALDPHKGYMYWSEWGKSQGIKKAAMDGSNQTPLVSTRGHATALTLDYEERRLYWVEANSHIASSDLNGNNKIIVMDDTRTPVGLTQFREHIYWSDRSGGVFQSLKTGGIDADIRRIYLLQDTITDLLVFHGPKQKGFNQCSANNGACKHLCLALPDPYDGDSTSFTCACPTHYTLHNNNKTCIPPKRFMIYSKRNLAVRLLPDTSDCLEGVMPIQGLKSVRAIDFDPVENYLYWIEGKTHSIKRADATGLQMSVLVHSNQDSYRPFDIALDPLGRLLFWTCSKQDVINITSLNSSATIGVVPHRDGEKPRLLAIHPTKRLLFYTDVGTTPQLIRIRLDGSHRIVITRANDIAAIAIDIENDFIVWVEGHSILISNIDGDNQHALLNESNSRITQLTVHSGWLYWLDRELDQLQRLELKSGNSRSVVLNHAAHVVDLVSVTQADRSSPCSPAHSRHCSHLCIMNGTSGAVCACPQGLALLDDGKTCSAVPNCGADHFTCSVQSSKDCIPVTWRCDGQKDCTDGSDEAGCPTCRADQFRCQNGDCIDQAQVCDGVNHCADHYDEAHCCKSANEFQCPRSKACIPRSLLCNGMENCEDGADEHKSICSDANKYMADGKSGSNTVIIVIFTVISAAVGFSVMFYFLRRRCNVSEIEGGSGVEDPLNPTLPIGQIKPQKLRKGIPDVVHMSMLNGSQSSSYDRNHITGASSSTNGSSSLNCYPRETLNPPPSPATTAASTRGSSPTSRYRPYRHYRMINQPPPPTPCSTDVCDESDYNYPTSRNRYNDCGPFPPPPTPRSHCHSESCPPSPSSRSSTYFSPLPPPPSPVQSPRSYDS